MRITLFLLLLCSTLLSAEQTPLADSVLVDKSDRKMWLIYNGERYREYDISLGDAPEGHKQQEGDERTPEGSYILDYRNPKSRYHLSIHINYPNPTTKPAPRQKALALVVIFLFTAPPTVWAGRNNTIRVSTGLTAALLSAIKRWKRFGSW